MTDLKKFCDICGDEAESPDQLMVPLKVSHYCVKCIKALNEYVQDITKEHISTMSNGVMYPKQIKNYLDRFVIKQDKAKEVLSVAIHNHLLRCKAARAGMRLPKNNVMLIGPTGTGKTYMTETLAKLIEVPFITVDITKYTEAGYVGADVESILAQLLKAANGVRDEAERGIVFIDEIDKIAEGRNGKGVSDIGVQRGLLKMLEGGEQTFNLGDGRMSGQASLHTDNILFIFGGAFSGLHEIIKAKSNDNHGIGFTNEVSNKDTKLKYGDVEVEHHHLVEFGMMPEFMGRASLVAELEPLETSDLIDIMTKAEDNVVEQYTTLFQMDGVELEFSKEFLESVAVEANKRGLGARGLKSIVEKALIPYLMEIDTGPKRLII